MAIIITNNPVIAEKYASKNNLCFYPEANYRQILIKVRDLVYVGHRLINHPLYGSLRPNETPYRTVVLSSEAGDPDVEDCMIMSEALTKLDHFTLPDKTRMQPNILRDYQFIDGTLLERTMELL